MGCLFLLPNLTRQRRVRFGEQLQITNAVTKVQYNSMRSFRKEARPRVRKRGSSQSSLFRYCERTWKFVYRVRGQSFSQVRHLVLRYVSLSNNRSIRSRRSENPTNLIYGQTTMSLLPSWRYVARNSLSNDSRWEVSALSEVKVALEDWFYSIREINQTLSYY